MPTDLTRGTDLADGLYGDLAVIDNISIREISGREGTDTTNGGTASIVYLVKGSSDPTVCRQALFDASTAGYLNLYQYDGLVMSDLTRRRGSDHGIDVWLFTASYNAITPQLGTYTISIDTTGAQILRTSSYAQSSYSIAGFTAPDYKKSVDVQEGKAQGVEVIVPALKINIRSKIATEYLGSPIRYANLIASLTGTTNNAAMFDDGAGNVYAQGELLFAGASGELVAEDPQLTFTFIASKNLSAVTIGDITGISKKGHEYLWYLFSTAKDATTGLLISKPQACYVDRVYGEADHTLLKIGVDAT